jgi:hypothetical protein
MLMTTEINKMEMIIKMKSSKKSPGRNKGHNASAMQITNSVRPI